MAATKPASSTTTPPFLNFFKEGLLLPGKNPILFAAIFAILVAWISLLLVTNELGIEPLKLKAVGDVDALKRTAARGSLAGHDDRLIRETLDDYGILLLAGVAYQVLVEATGSVIQLVSLFAAVTTYSGGDGDGDAVRTFGALLGRANQLKGAVATAAFVCALKTGAVALLSAASAVVASLAISRRYNHRGLFLAGWLLLVVAFVLYVYLCFLCSLAVVVALDEPQPASSGRRRHGGGTDAVRRAWQLAMGRQRRAMLFVTSTSVLAAVFRPVYWQAKICAGGDMPAGALLLGALYAVQMAAVELFQDCALTAFYYDCKGSRSAQESKTTEYVKLSLQDA